MSQQSDWPSSRKTTTNARKDVGEKEPSYTVSENVQPLRKFL
jgi:hypothetical protein